MTAEMERVKTAQITYAVRTTNIDGMDIERAILWRSVTRVCWQ